MTGADRQRKSLAVARLFSGTPGLGDGFDTRCALIVLADEIAQLRIHLLAPAAAREDAVVARTFDVVVEIIEVDKLAIHHNVEKTVDRLLRGMKSLPEIRVRTDEGEIEIAFTLTDIQTVYELIKFTVRDQFA